MKLARPVPVPPHKGRQAAYAALRACALAASPLGDGAKRLRGDYVSGH